MTAIDQLLQSFGASPAQALSSLFGTNPAESTEGTGEFAAALQAIKPATYTGQVTESDTENTSSIYSVTATDGVSSVEEIIAQYQAENSTTGTVDTAQSTGGKPSIVLAEASSKDFLEGIPGLQLTKLSTDQLAQIIESGQAVQNQTEAPDTEEAGLFVFGGTEDEPFHFLSLSELEGLLTEQPASADTVSQNTEVVTNAEAVAEEVAAVVQQSVIRWQRSNRSKRPMRLPPL